MLTASAACGEGVYACPTTGDSLWTQVAADSCLEGWASHVHRQKTFPTTYTHLTVPFSSLLGVTGFLEPSSVADSPHSFL